MASEKKQDKYYTSYSRMLRLYDGSGREFAFDAKNREEYAVWKKRLRMKLRRLTGIAGMKRIPPEPVLMSSSREPGFAIEKILLNTEPDVGMPVLVLLPNDITPGERRPAVIALHGHGGTKESVAGIPLAALSEKTRQYNTAYGAVLARMGFVVFCPDARGFGERRERMDQGDSPQKVSSSSCNHLNFAAISLGFSLTGFWIWDLMRLVDYIRTCGSIHPDKIGCCGFSGGGLQSLWLAAMDDRIACAAVSGYFHGYRGSIMRNNLCGCNFVPLLWRTADMGDIGSLVAPRPLFIETGRDDPLNGGKGVLSAEEQADVTRRAYRIFDAEENFVFHVFEGTHRWDGGHAYPFLVKHLG